MKLLHLVRNAHEGPVGGIEWVPGQPLMMTSGGDNSMKVCFLSFLSYKRGKASLTLRQLFHSNGSSTLPSRLLAS